ncbi:DctP family TRAP transporter solute-binding subunit [Sinomonas terrae]|uniref:DctP family TRAP transporter solute-binding subunit n=1 Tax=Sinomonas terrae TaxID=2908838 RepID=A0ABS9TWB1_9MICC|nr:DctP family TRAP transporter solute-binding subunit [Sinomonas terrae]MCH6468656.1 DctP family TRAP transporter solute-binding subunit [Sinomonas terrae]
MMRRAGWISALAAASVTALALAGCSGGAAASGSSTVEVKLSIPDPIGSSVGMAAQHFADEVKAKSNGSVKVTVIPNGTSFGGDQNAAVSRVQSGSLDAVILSTSVYAATDKKMNAVSLPYLFSSVDQEVKYLDGAPGKELLSDLAQSGTKGLAMLSRTPREVTNSVRPIQTPDDLKGLKIRVPGNPLWTKFFSAVGASPTPMNFSEVYTALQTGAINGQENPVEVPATNKFAEVQKYLSMTNHMSDAFVLAISDKKWNSLDSKDQQALQASADDTAAFKTKNDAQLADTQVKQLESQGMKVNDLSPEGAAQFKTIARSLYPQFADTVGGADFLKTTVDFVDGQ